MKIYGQLSVTTSDWRLIYNSIINYLNLKIRLANKYANEIFLECSEKSIQETRKKIDSLLNENLISNEIKYLIESSLFVGSSTKIYKPKQKSFQLLSNRTEYLNFGSIIVFFNKKENTIEIETSQFDDFDKYLNEEQFIGEFINMVNTIDWPERTGPKVTTRGCTLIKETQTKKIIFYKVGSNPPILISNLDETISEPKILQSSIFKDIALVKKEDVQQQLVVEEKIDFDL